MSTTSDQISILFPTQEFSVTYNPCPTSSVGGSYLRDYVDGIRIGQILEVFPDAEVPGVDDPEKGYDEPDCVFCDPSTGSVFNVYSRFGSVRIGAQARVTDEAVQKFKTWLLAQV